MFPGFLWGHEFQTFLQATSLFLLEKLSQILIYIALIKKKKKTDSALLRTYAEYSVLDIIFPIKRYKWKSMFDKFYSRRSCQKGNREIAWTCASSIYKAEQLSNNASLRSSVISSKIPNSLFMELCV